MSIVIAGRTAGLSRRRFVQGIATGGAPLGLGHRLAAGALPTATRAPVLAGTDFQLSIGESPVNFTGRTRAAITVNGSLPVSMRYATTPSEYTSERGLAGLCVRTSSGAM